MVIFDGSYPGEGSAVYVHFSQRAELAKVHFFGESCAGQSADRSLDAFHIIGRGAQCLSLKLLWELADDACAEHIGHS